MGKNIYFINCIREIRQCVYGRDNRKPIADSLELLRKRYSGDITKLENKFATRVQKIHMLPHSTWYTYTYENINFPNTESGVEDQLAVVTDGKITVGAISGTESEFLATDNISGDGVTALTGDDYQWNVLNPVTETHVHHGEDWTLQLLRANGS